MPHFLCLSQTGRNWQSSHPQKYLVGYFLSLCFMLLVCFPSTAYSQVKSTKLTAKDRDQRKTIQLAISSAEARLTASNAALNLAKANYARSKNLFEKKAISRTELERRNSELIEAEATFIVSGMKLELIKDKLKPKRPNIIYIMADDLGYAELGCYGQKKINTPNIDRLAAQGIKFTQHYTSAPVCAPARCSLMTGKHGGHALVRTNYELHPPEYPFKDKFGGQYPLRKNTVTIATILKKAGYATGAFGKWGIGGVGTTGDPLNQGFDRFFGFNCQRHAHNLYPRYLVDDNKQYLLKGNTRGVTGKQFGPQVIADKMLEFIRQNKSKPFFVYYPTVIPHLALQAPEKSVAKYRGKWKEVPYKGRSYQPNETPRATYAAMISFMDDQVGRIMKLLKELDLDDNTIVIFTSDNGATHLNLQVDVKFFNSVGPLRGLKGSLYEGGIREPMVARWPGKIKAGSVSDLPSAHYDSLATLAEIAGVKVPEDTDGISYLPTLLGQTKKQKKHEYLFWDFAGYGGQTAVRMSDWKGIKRGLKRKPDAPLELYHLKTDIAEKQNVAKKYPKIAAKIQQIMLRARTKPEVKRFQFGRYQE